MRLPLLLLLCLPATAVSAQKILTTDASLSSVMLYRSGVEMNHKAKISLPSGSSEIVVGNVSNAVLDHTIQVGANSNVTILSVRFSQNHLKPLATTEERNRLNDSLTTINKILTRLANQKATDNSVLRLLETNSLKVGNDGGLSVTELIKLTDYYKNKQNEVKNNIATIEEQETLLETKEEKIKEQLDELSQEKYGATGLITLQVMVKNAAVTDFNISYISPKASWSAFYDLRADNTTDPLNMVYKANVVQNTGLDWHKVKLTLSSGNPTVSGTAPSISSWSLRYRSLYSAADISKKPVTDIIEALSGTAAGIQVSSGGGQPGSSPDIVMRGYGSLSNGSNPLIVLDGVPYEGSLSTINPSDVASINLLKDANAVALYGSRGSNGVVIITTKNKTLSQFTSASENDLNATFEVDLPYDIASNDKPHSVTLQDYKVPVKYQYLAVPKMDPDAFLMANITQYEKLNLLPGLANIIFENMYVGNSYINPNITADTLNLSMGRDKKIIIKREKITELSGLKSSGKDLKQTFTFEIQIRNGKKESVDLLLKDQYPVATEKDMDIELLQSDGAQVDKETGILSWNLKLEAGESRKIRISYSVKHPANKPVANL